MKKSIRAVVQTGPEALEIQTFAKPLIGENDALLRVEACGICGTDCDSFAGQFPLQYPIIPGHEPVGSIEEIGPLAAQRWGLAPGDRVVVQSDFGCGRCLGCLNQQACKVSPGSYGFMPTALVPALWGGFAEMLYLAPGSIPHKISQSVEPRTAALYNLLGAGFSWAVDVPGLRYGDTLAIFGTGQRGLACVIAAAASGAQRIFATGLGSCDSHKMALAAQFGAEVIIDVETDNAVECIMEATGGRGVDISVDTTPHAAQPVLDAVRCTRPGGTIVLAGLKGAAGVSQFPADEVAMRYQTIKGVRAVDYHSFRRAVQLIESGSVPIERMHTHHFSLEQAAAGIRALSHSGDEGSIAITIEPGL